MKRRWVAFFETVSHGTLQFRRAEHVSLRRGQLLESVKLEGVRGIRPIFRESDRVTGRRVKLPGIRSIRRPFGQLSHRSRAEVVLGHDGELAVDQQADGRFDLVRMDGQCGPAGRSGE